MGPASRKVWLASRMGACRLAARLRSGRVLIAMLLALLVATPISATVAGRASDGLSAPGAPRLGTGALRAAQLVSIATLPDLSIAAVQNDHLPGSILDDRRLLLGGVGSDLWRSTSDPPGELWMVTDRGPNAELDVDGERRRTFPV